MGIRYSKSDMKYLDKGQRDINHIWNAKQIENKQFEK
jgi:hypothetical protein